MLFQSLLRYALSVLWISVVPSLLYAHTFAIDEISNKHYNYLSAGYCDTSIGSTFFPMLSRSKNTWYWWDRGSILFETGAGYRTLLSKNFLFGLYGQYHMTPINNSLRTRIGGGIEIANELHHLVVHGYYTVYMSHRLVPFEILNTPSVVLKGVSISYYYDFSKKYTFSIDVPFAQAYDKEAQLLPFECLLCYVGLQMSLTDYITFVFKVPIPLPSISLLRFGFKIESSPMKMKNTLVRKIRRPPPRFRYNNFNYPHPNYQKSSDERKKALDLQMNPLKEN